MATSVQITFDCADPDRLASFWAAALKYKKQDPPEGYASWQEYLAAEGITQACGGVPEDRWNAWSAVVDPDGSGPRIYFQQVPEPKSAKNRVHLDLNVTQGVPEVRRVGMDEGRKRVAAEVERLIGLGATKLGIYDQHAEHWTIMADPEGNEFCVQ